MCPDTGAPNAHNTRCVPIRGNGADVSALHQLRRSVSVDNPNQALAQVGVGSHLSLSLVEAMPCRGNVRRRAHIVGRIGGFGKFRGIREGRALPARLICKPGGLLTWLTGYIYVPGHRICLKIITGGVELIITSHLTQPLKTSNPTLHYQKKHQKNLHIKNIVVTLQTEIINNTQ